MSESNAASVAAVDERMGQLARGLVTGDAFFALRAYRALYLVERVLRVVTTPTFTPTTGRATTCRRSARSA